MPIATDGQGNALFLDQDGQWKPARKATNPQTGESLAFDGQQWKPIQSQQDSFVSRAASMDPIDLSVARSKNDAFGDYLRNQAMQPQQGETEDQRFKRLYGSLSQGGEAGRSNIEGMTRSALQGETVGLGDELTAAIAASNPMGARGGGWSDRYSQNLNAERARLDAYRQDHPVLAYGSEIAGAAPTLAAPYLRGVQAAPGAGLGARMAAGAATGAGQGAFYGFNAGEGGFGSRIDTAKNGALVGGVVGGAAPPAIDAVSYAARWGADQVLSRLGRNYQASAAARKVAQALIRDGLTPDEAAAKINQLGPEGALMDVGANTRELAASTARAPGAGKSMLNDFVVGRQEGTRGANNVLQGGQINRITQGIDDLVPERYGAPQRAALEAARANTSRPLYQQSVNSATNMVPDEQFAQVAGDPFLASEFSKVKSNKLFGMGDLPDNSMPVIDAVKKSLDDQISAAQRQGNNNAARLLTQKKDALVGMADEAFPGYQQARDVWRQYSGVIDAGDLGRKFMRGDVDVVKQAVKSMSPEEAAQFRVGAAQALRDKVGSLVNRADATKKLKDIPALEEKVRTAFGDDKTFAKYIDMLNNERTMFDTYAALRGGSQTAERLAADADTKVDPGALAAAGVDLASNPWNPMAWLRGAKAVSGRAAAQAKTPEPVRRELAKILMGNNTIPLNSQMQAQIASEAQRRNLARLMTQGAIVTGPRN